MRPSCLRLPVLILITSICGLAAEVRRTDRVLPLVQDGGGWSTSITLVNLEKRPAPFEVQFRTNFAKDWVLGITGDGLQVEGPYVRGTVPPSGSVTLQTPGKADTAARGYAFLLSIDTVRLAATATIRRANPAASLQIGICPDREDFVVLPFDNTNGASTSMVWVSETSYTLADFTIQAQDGARLSDGQFQFNSGDYSSQLLMALADRFPETKNQRGTLRINVSFPSAGIYDDLFFTAFAIQTDASGAMYTVGSMSTDRWQANPH